MTSPGSLSQIFTDLDIRPPECHSFIGVGWLPIVRTMLTSLKAIQPGIVIGQIKQKFGDLRVYLDQYDPDILAVIQIAEAVCRQTCEACGREPGLLGCNIRNWLSVLCERCQHEVDTIPYSSVEERKT